MANSYHNDPLKKNYMDYEKLNDDGNQESKLIYDLISKLDIYK